MLAARAASAWPQQDRVGQVLRPPRPAAGDDGDRNRPAHRRGDLQIVAVLRAVGIHAVSTISPAPSRSTSRAQATASRPVPIRPPLICTSQTSRPSFRTRLGSMFTTMHWLPNRRAAWRTKSGSRTAAELIETLSLPAFNKSRMSSIVRMPPPTRQRHEDDLGGAADDVEHDRPPLVAGGDVEKHQLVGPLGFVARGHLDRIAGIAEIEEIGPLDDPAAIDIQTGNDALGKHSKSPGNQRLPAESR